MLSYLRSSKTLCARAFRTIPLLMWAACTSYAVPVHLRCEAQVNPLGIDTAKPSFSWRSEETVRNWRQSAYQVLVASKLDFLQSGKADVWDSGKQPSGESASIFYAGPALESRHRYFWTVRVWDAKGHAAQASELAWWEMGLLAKPDWTAQWIRWQNPEEAADAADLKWIWVRGQDAIHVLPKTAASFHLDFDLPDTPNRAALFLIAHGTWKVVVNGHDAGTSSTGARLTAFWCPAKIPSISRCPSPFRHHSVRTPVCPMRHVRALWRPC